MTMMRIFPLLIVAGACAASEPQVTVAPPPPPAAAQVAVMDPVGTYEYSTVVDGQTATGTMQIVGAPGAYTGRILSNLFPEIPIVGVTVDGKSMLIRATMPDGDLLIKATFDDQKKFTGNWELGGQTGDFSGKKH